jgi:hypothetical protein
MDLSKNLISFYLVARVIELQGALIVILKVLFHGFWINHATYVKHEVIKVGL